jgi:glutamyl/glutaminyl-tRNA synthetase
MPLAARFAPTTSGRAHPGTLLAGLLAWLDARSRGATLTLRLEDLDPDRCRPAYAAGLQEDLAWFGLDWDAVVMQSQRGAAHAAALDRLAAAGRLYPSSLSRRELAAIGRRAPDGGWAYDNCERRRPLPPDGWRACTQPLRCRLDDGPIALHDESGLDLSQDPAREAGDPLVRRRDGVIAYCLAVVVDDADLGIGRVVRGRDIAPGTATQVALQRLLGLPTPVYRHHLLLWERSSDAKLSKSHGAVSAPELRAHLRPDELCGFLAWCAGLLPEARPCRPSDLLPGFAWSQVSDEDAAITWDGSALRRATGACARSR